MAARRSSTWPTLNEDSAAGRCPPPRSTLEEDSAAASCSATRPDRTGGLPDAGCPQPRPTLAEDWAPCSAARPTLAEDSATAWRSAVRPTFVEDSAAARRSAARLTFDEDSAAARFSTARPNLDEDSAAARCSAARRPTLGVDLVAVGLAEARPRNHAGEKTAAPHAAVRRAHLKVGSAAARALATRHRSTACTRAKEVVDAGVREDFRTTVEEWGGRLVTGSRLGAGDLRPPTSRRTGAAAVAAPCAGASRSRLECAPNPRESMEAAKHSGCRCFDAGEQAERKPAGQQPTRKIAHPARTQGKQTQRNERTWGGLVVSEGDQRVRASQK